MFSWKNIKDTYNEKVKNSDSAGDKTLGLLEVVGKSLVSGATIVVKELPSIANKMADTASEHYKDNADRVLRNSNSSQESREKAQLYLEKHSEIKDTIREHQQKIKDSSTGYYDQESIKAREANSYSLKIDSLKTNLEKYREQLMHYEEKKQKLVSQLGTISDEDQKTKDQETIDQLNNILTEYELKIAETEAEIEKYSKRLEGY